MALGPKTQREQTLVVIAAVAFILAGVYYYYVFRGAKTRVAATRAHVTALQQQNKLVKIIMAKKGSVEAIKLQAQRSEQALDVMRRLVPLSNEVPALIDQVSTAARREGLDVAELTPEATIIGDQFDTYRFRIGLLGGYHNIAAFLTNVGSLSRIVAPINLQLTLPSDANKAALHKRGSTVLEARFEVQTYVTRAAPPPSDAPPGKSKS